MWRTGLVAVTWRKSPAVTFLFCPTVEVVCQQCDCRRLLPAPAHLHLHQRAGLRLPPPQPQKRFPEEALRWPEVWREESGGGSLRPLHPGFQQGDGSSLRGEVGGSPPALLTPVVPTRPSPAPPMVVRIPRHFLTGCVVFQSWNTF